MMERWEYFQTSIPLELKGSARRRQEAMDGFYQALNGIGAQGWEMVGFTADHGDRGIWFLMMFKRRLPE